MINVPIPSASLSDYNPSEPYNPDEPTKKQEYLAAWMIDILTALRNGGYAFRQTQETDIDTLQANVDTYLTEMDDYLESQIDGGARDITLATGLPVLAETVGIAIPQAAIVYLGVRVLSAIGSKLAEKVIEKAIPGDGATSADIEALRTELANVKTAITNVNQSVYKGLIHSPAPFVEEPYLRDALMVEDGGNWTSALSKALLEYKDNGETPATYESLLSKAFLTPTPDGGQLVSILREGLVTESIEGGTPVLRGFLEAGLTQVGHDGNLQAILSQVLGQFGLSVEWPDGTAKVSLDSLGLIP